MRFFIGGRTLGPVVTSISYAASPASAWTILSLSAAAFGPVVVLRLAGVRLNPKFILPAMVMGLVLTIFFYLRSNSVGDILERLVPFLISFILLCATKQNQLDKG